MRCPEFFVGWESSLAAAAATAQEKKDDLPNSSQLQSLQTDDAAGFFVAPICNHLSSSLRKLAFWWDEQVRCFTEEQEKALQLLTSLHDLQFLSCQNLVSLTEGLHSLPSLKTLKISSCQLIRSLPEKGLPSSLQELELIDCSEELKEQCRKLEGIPKIRLSSLLDVVYSFSLVEFYLHLQF